MLKVSFKGDFRKVQTFNDKATTVTLTGKCVVPSWFKDIPNKIWEWVMWHPSVDAGETYDNGNTVLLMHVSGKSVCADGDTFDAKVGERIAECRAKIRLYRFMQTLTAMLLRHYLIIATGDHSIPPYKNNDCLLASWHDYTEMLYNERCHLNELLQKAL